MVWAAAVVSKHISSSQVGMLTAILNMALSRWKEADNFLPSNTTSPSLESPLVPEYSPANGCTSTSPAEELVEK